MKTFMDVGFVKQCLKAVTKDIFPDKSKLISNLMYMELMIFKKELSLNFAIFP